MGTREVLVNRTDVRNEDIDDIIAIAAELQDEDQAVEQGPSTSELKAVAEELDIDPAYVDEAIGKLAEKRAAEAAAEEEAERAAEANMAMFRNLVLAGGAVIALGVGALGVGLTGLAVMADGRLDSALHERDQAEQALSLVLDRQATLAPQLVALGGGQADALKPLTQAVQQAPDLEARLKAADELAVAMATQLGKLPPATDEATNQSRANLQYEVTGTTNRITTEKRRWKEASLRYEEARRGLGATLAMTFGLH